MFGYVPQERILEAAAAITAMNTGQRVDEANAIIRNATKDAAEQP